jgi:transcriptional regulator with XRE-family HTH domain
MLDNASSESTGTSNVTSLDFPQEIKRFRKLHGESQTKFGDRFGVKRLAVANWEKGSKPNSDHLPQLTQLLTAGTEQACEGAMHQLLLPFDPPISVALKISPQSNDTIHFEIHLKVS